MVFYKYRVVGRFFIFFRRFSVVNFGFEGFGSFFLYWMNNFWGEWVSGVFRI